ncbi:MAG: putative protease, partial [bacterium]
RGFEAGQVVSISLAKKQKSIDVTSTVEISAGDGLLFVNLETGREIGGKVYQSEEIKKNNYRLAFANDFSIHELEPKNVIYLNHSSQLSKKLDSTWTDKTKFKQIPLSISVSGKEGDFLTVQVIDDSGHQVTVSSQSNLQTASKAPLSFEALKKNFGALGGTCFQLINLNNELEGDLFLHQKELKEIRRNFSQQLETLRTKKVEIEILSENEVQDWFTNQTTQAKESSNNKDIALNVLIRKKEQLEYLKDLPIHTVYFDFEFGKDYKVALKQARELGVVAGIATTRILKPKEYGHLRYIQKLAPDIILVRNLGALHYFQENEFEVPFVGDYSLNVTNHLTSNYLLSKGLQQLCPSYDLNQEQLEDLVKTTGGENFEVTIHQYIPAFHMEHCVFAGFLSEGTSYKDCGRPCEKYQVELKDTFGQKHPVQADMECRNTMFNGKPQSSAFLIPSLIENGVQAFRFEALTEDKEELRNKILHYHDVITGEKTPEQLFQALGVTEKVGFGEGQLRSTKTYKDRKKKR